jgi:hypothetical protein
MNMEAIIPGEKVKLRRDMLEYVSIREWEFCGINKGMILLKHEGGQYTLEVKPEEIDWKGEGQRNLT